MPFKNHRYKHSQNETILRSGLPFFNRLETLIDAATFSIHIQVYIFDVDKTGTIILDKLIAATKRGVQVYIVVDNHASPDFTDGVLSRLKSHGIFVKQFSPFHLRGFKIGRRLHHKVILIDESTALVGGINISDKYSGYNGNTPWLDLAVELSGPVCQDIKDICVALWSKKIKRKWTKHIPSYSTFSTSIKARVLQNDWWRRKIEISSAYLNAIRHAQHEITIMASYFLPSFRKRLLLKKANKRGVAITIILGGHNDVPLLKPAMQYLYRFLFTNNIKIYEWTPTIMHGKMAIADNLWTTIGSYNINALSDYGSLELNIEINDKNFAQQSSLFVQQIIKEGCVEIDAQHYLNDNNLFRKIYRWSAYRIVRILLLLLFILMRRDRLKTTSF